MAKAERQRQLTDPDWGLVYRFAIALEKGRFNEYIAILKDSRTLFKKSLVAGLGKGLGAVIGGTVVVALLVALLALVKPILPDGAQKAVDSTTQKLQQPAK